ncbi:hypothetical protein VF21_00140 [Pseudogymnoascus sp. 05NY08]|nr:hypothetical protein VF21_00155 [Pseudogymnoascus sp. 05NY08]OBT80914.1 hypothetical protein VF21_00140 [Pseudogymnoascus sp. 05NY08]
MTAYFLLRLSSVPLALSLLPPLTIFFFAPSTPSILTSPSYFLGVTCLVVGTGSDLYTLVALLRSKPTFNILLNLAPVVFFSASRVLLSFNPATLDEQPAPQTPRSCIILLNFIVFFHALLSTFTIQGYVDGRRMRRESWAAEEFQRNGWSVDQKNEKAAGGVGEVGVE